MNMNKIPIYSGLLLVSGGIFAFAKFFIGAFGVIDPFNSIFAVSVAIFAGYVLLSAYEVLDFTVPTAQIKRKATVLFLAFMVVEAAGYSFFSYSSIFDDEKTRWKLASQIDIAFDKQNERNAAFVDAIRKDIGHNVGIAASKRAYISVEKANEGYESISGILETKNKLDRQIFNDYVYHKTEIAESKNPLAFFNDIAENTSMKTAVVLLVVLCTAFATLLTFGMRFVNLRRKDHVKINPNLSGNDVESDSGFEEDNILFDDVIPDEADSEPDELETAGENATQTATSKDDYIATLNNGKMQRQKKTKAERTQAKIIKLKKQHPGIEQKEIAKRLKTDRTTIYRNEKIINGKLTNELQQEG